jgi:hypothetical protein
MEPTGELECLGGDWGAVVAFLEARGYVEGEDFEVRARDGAAGWGDWHLWCRVPPEAEVDLRAHIQARDRR